MAAIGGNADEHGDAKASAGLMETAQRLEVVTKSRKAYIQAAGFGEVQFITI